MRKEITFKTTIDGPTAAFSIGIMAFALGILGTLWLVGSKVIDRQAFGVIMMASMGVVVLALSIAQGFLPSRITVDPEHVIIRRPFGDKVLLRNEISDVRRMIRDERRMLMRLFGGEGVFGYVGRFRSSCHRGGFWVYARRRPREWVMIETRNKKYVVAPVDGDRFVELLKPQTSAASVNANTTPR